MNSRPSTEAGLAVAIWMELNTEVIASITVIISIAVGVSLLLAATSYPRQIRRSLNSYAIGKFLVAAGFAVAALRRDLPPIVPVSLANGLVMTGLYWNYVAFRELQGKSGRVGGGVFVGLAAAVGCAVVLALAPGDLNAVRVLTSALTVVIMMAMAVELLFFYEGRGVAHYVNGALAVLVCAAHLHRLVAALVDAPTPTSQLADDTAERLVFIVTFLGLIIGAINFVLMASDEFNKELSRLAHVDSLTGVYNRRRLLELGERERQRARRFGKAVTVLMLDIDHFKEINDTWGHPFGDAVIRAVAQACVTGVREVDMVGRIGGEEFALVLAETPLDVGLAIAERLRAAIADTPVEATGKVSVRVTCSIGGASCQGDADSGFAQLIARADVALYEAKNAGRDRVRFAP